MPRQNPAVSTAALLETAHALADAAGSRILPHFRKPIAIDNKDRDGKFDPVTIADTAAERAMRKLLAARHPDHGIVGEEFAETAGTSPYRWVLDPIDGTRAFIMGYPLWGVLVGLVHHDKPLIGLMDQPHTRERFWSDGKVSFMRDAAGRTRRIKTRTNLRLEDAILTSTAPDLFKSTAEKSAFARVSAQVKLTRFGGDCYAYCMLASGMIDLVIESGLKAVDIVALIPIIERAGGRVTTWDGRSPLEGGRIIAAGDPKIHAAALELLNSR